MGRSSKNLILKEPRIIGPDIRENMYKEVVRNGTPFPTEPLSYEDIDKEFERGVKEDLELVYDGKKLETVVMYSNQRFSEFMQNWEFSDNNKNMLLHFKAITRERNPKGGTIVDSAYNIPGDRWYTMKRSIEYDKSGRPFFALYKIKQPYAIDLNYKVSIVTNNLEVINDFNNLINEKFKSKQCYIRPNGHFIPMEIVNIGEESENDLKGRQYMSQTYQIKVLGYIINKNDMAVFEEPINKIIDMSCEEGSIIEYSSSVEEYSDNSVKIETIVSGNISKITVKPDVSFYLSDIIVNGIQSMLLFINGVQIICEIYNNRLYKSVEYDRYGNVVGTEMIVAHINNGDEIVYKAVKTCPNRGKPSISLIGNKD